MYEMTKVMSHLSSFLRSGPIPSHNLLQQLLNLDEKYTVHCVHCNWDFKQIIILVIPYFRE